MSADPTRRTRLIKRALISIAIVICAGIMAVYGYYRRTYQSPAEAILSHLPRDTQVAMGTVEHTATVNGKPQWSMKANSAQLLAKEKQLILDHPRVTFFMDSGEEIVLNADTGMLDTETNDIEVSGNVMVQNAAYRLQTDKLTYRHDTRVMASDSGVTIHSAWADLNADAVSFHLDDNTADFKGHVNGQVTAPII